ncbi:MAG: protein kinase [Polyangiales bacterium]
MRLGSPSLGDVVGGKYRLDRALGGGGMSVVFAAENTLTGKQVALKFLLASLAERPDGRARLLREARACARIKHRHVVDVYDVGVEGDTMFLVMDLLHGETLSHLLETSTLPVRAFLKLLIQAMRGVAEAHRLGIVHRDIKPDNIFLAREVDHDDAIPTVLDFGIAKIEGESLHTRSGSATGTPVFMAYEQIKGARDLDARVDVYGFGMVIYLALAGRLPFTSESWPELIFKLTTCLVPPLSTLRADLPQELVDVVARAMARERDERTASIEQLIRELTPFAERDDLGETRRVTYGRDAEHAPMVTTLPAQAVVLTPPTPVHSEPALSTRTGDLVFARRRRWYAAAGAVAALLAIALVSRATQEKPPAAKTVAAQTVTVASQPVQAPPMQALNEVVDASVSAPPPLESTVKAPRLVRVRSKPVVEPAVAPEPAVVPEPAPALDRRRKLSQDDFFGAR